MKSLLFCCLFGTFLATGLCLECETCAALGQNCSGPKRTCEDKDDRCVIFQTEVKRDPVSLTFTAKVCGTSDICHLDYVETNIANELALRSKRVCCTGDECETLPPLVLEPQDTQPNGLQCPGCIGLSSIECNEHLVSCRASEDQCLSVTGKHADFIVREMSLKGCASQSLCTLLNKKFWPHSEDIEMDIKCTPALPQPSW